LAISFELICLPEVKLRCFPVTLQREMSAEILVSLFW